MLHKDPTSWGFYNWCFVVVISCSGGFVSWIGKIRNGHSRAFNIVEFIGELVTSGFVGVMVFMLLQSMDQPEGVSSAAAGISGHSATRLLFLVERMIEKKFHAYFNTKS